MRVSIAECPDYDTEKVFNAVKKAVSDIGFNIERGKKVLIKPNVLGQHKPEECITTHPTVIEALIRLFEGCNIVIAESSGFYKDGGTNKALEISGMKAIAEKHNIRLINLEQKPIRKADGGFVYKHPEISGEIFNVDLVINVPKLKTHTLMKYTGAVKNLFGCVPGGRKQRLHAFAQKPEKFANVLVDIFQSIKPALNVMDAVTGIEGNGPGSSGVKKQTGIILASQNAAALDIVASEIIGYRWQEVLTNRICADRRLVVPEEIEIIGNKRKVNYKKPVNVSKMPGFLIGWAMNQAAMRPYAIKDKCTKCSTCMKICPVGAISMKPYPKINSRKCISCYCCHETCPYGAMDLKGSALIEILRKAKNLVLRPKK